MTTVFDFENARADGSTTSLDEHRGKVLLIVNVASKCGLTPQYEGLEALQREFGERGLQVIGFPCNQFLGQEPGTNDEIQEFCGLTYDVSFPVLGKVDVNGPDAAPIFDHLRAEAPGDWGPAYGDFYERLKEVSPAEQPGDIVWNFTKFLVDRDGRVVQRFEPPVTPDEIKPAVEQALQAS